ncbi:MAG: replication factor A protein 3 [Benniella sp.]|nr:MAG: replication factor A protein 3 [Benniella sp.]
MSEAPTVGFFPATPRVNSAMLRSHVDERVRFVGKIIEQNGSRALMTASDKGQVEVVMNVMSQYGTQYVEVIGFARSNGTIDEEVSINFGNDFDMDTYNELITKMQRFPTVF